MQLIDTSFILLIIATFLILFFIRYTLKDKPITQMQKMFAFMLSTDLILCSRSYSSKGMLFAFWY